MSTVFWGLNWNLGNEVHLLKDDKQMKISPWKISNCSYECTFAVISHKLIGQNIYNSSSMELAYVYCEKFSLAKISHFNLYAKL
jgi:hypothetical protein